MPTNARAQRLARGWIVGLVATTVAAVSHALAGGYRPGILSFAVALVFAGLLGTAVIGRRPSLPRLALAVGGSQLAFHLLFSLLGAGAGDASSVSAPSGPMGMDGMSPTPLAAMAPRHDHLADPAMWIAHAIAAVLTVLFLRHAELAVWTMLTRALGRAVAVAAPIVGPLPSERPASRPALPAIRPLVSRLLLGSARRRGPPLLTF